MRNRNRRHLEFLLQDRASAAALLGAAPPRPALPPEFTWHDYTIFLLAIAAQIEHSLMVQSGYPLNTRRRQ